MSDKENEEARANDSGLWRNARFLLKYGRSSEGNWNNYKFVVQVQQALIIADIKYILHRLTVLFSCIAT